MIKNFFILLILVPSLAFSQPTSSGELDEIQLYFGDLTEFRCCYLLSKDSKAPFDGFLLEPYQLVFIKDTIDSWQQELSLQLKQVNQICDEKLNLCQSNRDMALEELRKEIVFYTDLSDNLNNKLVEVKSNYKIFKIATFIAIPLAITLGVYIRHKF